MGFLCYVRLSWFYIWPLRAQNSVLLATPNGDGQSALPHPKGFGLFYHEKYTEQTVWHL